MIQVDFSGDEVLLFLLDKFTSIVNFLITLGVVPMIISCALCTVALGVLLGVYLLLCSWHTSTWWLVSHLYIQFDSIPQYPAHL